ncbi:Translation initiation factor RLI1 [Pichia kudriavzevii]|uniref:Translation initiation factor RLI1 n=1 Tax=Pichia kudriavzevii TaxID=4909 RepID=A0A1V2LTF4_PICKU|nr:Translation initiation factor RLI1 [Pichia kudriavzevii]
MPRPGQVLGLVGTNGIGKSTALKILSGKLKPNLGRYDDPPQWEDIIKHFRGSELQNYFTKVLEEQIKAIIKPQYVDNIPRAIKGPLNKVGELLKARSDGVDSNNIKEVIKMTDLGNLLNREVSKLSGGELQRFAIGMTCIQKANVYMFDEPSSYLDVKQRLLAALIIRSLSDTEVYTIVVEHDLSVLDYLSDYVCILYGVPSVYGVVSFPASVREGINIFLDGHIPSENLRFRTESLQFRLTDASDHMLIEQTSSFTYPDMVKTQGDFKLHVEAGSFNDSEIIVMMGENGTVAITLALGKPADIYLIDEPSAYLDSEQRIICAKVIRRFIIHSKKTAFIVEHDFIMATYMADKVMVFEGKPSVDATAKKPESLLTGCNRFLKNLNVTFRRDPTSFRPRINKLDSQMDKEQKANGDYFFLENNKL